MKPKLKVSEKATQSAIIQYLEYKGYTVFDLRRPKFSRGKGCPDLLAWKKSQCIVFIEIKSPDTYYTATKEQQEFFEDLKMIDTVKGGVARSIQDVEKILSL